MRFMLLLIPILLLFLSSCSPQGEDENPQTIKEAAEERGHQAAQQINYPLEQAQLTKQIQENRDQKIKETVDQ